MRKREREKRGNDFAKKMQDIKISRGTASWKFQCGLPNLLIESACVDDAESFSDIVKQWIKIRTYERT